MYFFLSDSSIYSSLKLYFYILISSLLFSSYSFAQAPINEQEEALLSLVNVLNTDIATRNNFQSTDKSPGVITILEGHDLKLMGITTVLDALSLVPGFIIPQAGLRGEEPSLRGVGGILDSYSGKLRYMLNGQIMNNVFFASGGAMLQIPIEQVERIEVLRGTGSAIYGEYAYLGVVNVITKTEGRELYVSRGDFSSYSVGGLFDFDLSKDLKGAVNINFQKTNGASILSGEDVLFSFAQGSSSNSPGQPNLGRELMSMFFDLNKSNWQLSAFYLQEMRGDAFGSADALSLPQRYFQTIDQYGVEFRNTNTINQWDVDYNVAVKHFLRTMDDLWIYPKGGFGIYIDGIHGSSSEAENRYEVAFRFTRDWQDHLLLLSFEFSQSQSDDIYTESNVDHSSIIPGIGLPPPLPEVTESLYGYENKSRENINFYISDQIALSDDLQLTTGIRFDDYSDVGQYVSSRLDVFYRLNEKHILKSQVSKGFRPPTFAELYLLYSGGAGNGNLSVETISTIEFSHNFRNNELVLMTTLYHSEMNDVIYVDDNAKYQNGLNIDAHGLEIDFENKLSFAWKLFGNITRQDVMNKTTRSHIQGSSDVLANINLLYQPRSKYTHLLRFRYTGKAHRSIDDERDKASASSIFDYTATIHDFINAGTTVSLNIYNVFDDDYIKPSPILTYANDYPQPERSIWMRLSHTFH